MSSSTIPIGGGGGGGRTLLTANKNLYVATTGSDANDGLSAGSPFLTIQKAINVAAHDYDLQGFDVTINIADGSYPENLSPKGTVGDGRIQIKGNTTTPSSVNISPATGKAVLVGQQETDGSYLFEGVKFALGTPTNNQCIWARGDITIAIKNVVFGAAGHHVLADRLGRVFIEGDYEVDGGADVHLWARYGGKVMFTTATTVTFTGSPNFPAACWIAANFGFIEAEASITNSGTVTGKKFDCKYNSHIRGSSKAPGSTAGSTNNSSSVEA